MAILYLFPEGEGDETNIGASTGSTHWGEVDDQTDGIPDPDDALTYIESLNKDAWTRDLYQTQNSTTGTGAINNVKIYFRCSTETTGSAKNSIKVFWDESSQVYDYDPDDGEYHGTGGNKWSTHCKTLTANPHTGSAWTWAEIDACQCGINLWSEDKLYSSACTLVYLEVDYTPLEIVSDTGTGTEEIHLAIPFSDTITDLSDNTTYYFRAKIQDSDGNWYYGEEKQFTTEEKPYTPITVEDANLVTTEDIGIKEVFALVLDTNLITTEIISIDKTLALTDLGTSIEVVNIVAEVSIADSGISTDVISIDVALTVPDSGIGIEDVKVSKILILTDSGHGIDIISIVGRISVTDFTVSVEIIGVTTQLLVPDSSSWSFREFW